MLPGVELSIILFSFNFFSLSGSLQLKNAMRGIEIIVGPYNISAANVTARLPGCGLDQTDYDISRRKLWLLGLVGGPESDVTATRLI